MSSFGCNHVTLTLTITSQYCCMLTVQCRLSSHLHCHDYITIESYLWMYAVGGCMHVHGIRWEGVTMSSVLLVKLQCVATYLVTDSDCDWQRDRPTGPLQRGTMVGWYHIKKIGITCCSCSVVGGCFWKNSVFFLSLGLLCTHDSSWEWTELRWASVHFNYETCSMCL